MTSVAHKLVSGSLLRVLNLVASLVVSFFLTPFIIHSIGDRAYGLWVLVGTFIGYYGLLDLGLSNAIGRYISRAIGAGDTDEINRVYNTGFALFLLGGGLALSVTVVAALLTPTMVDNPADVPIFRAVLLILGVHSAIDLPMRVFHGLLQARLRFDLLAYLGMATLAVRTLLIVGAIHLGYGLVGLALSTLAASLLADLVYVRLAYRSHPGLHFNLSRMRRETVRLLFSYSIFVFILQIAKQLRFHAAAFVITAYVGLAAVAHFNIASMLVQYFDMLMGRVMGVLTPYFSQLDGAHDHEATGRVLFFATKISVTVSSFVAFGLVFWGEEFIERWMGVDYLDAYPCLAVLVAGVLFSFWQTPSISLLYGTSRHGFLAWVTIVEGLCNLGLSILLVRQYGILGVAIGATIPMVIHKALIQPVYVCRVCGIALSAYLRNLGQAVLGVGVGLILPLLMARQWVRPDYGALFTLAATSFALYAVIAWYLVFSTEERGRVRQLLGGRIGRPKTVDV